MTGDNNIRIADLMHSGASHIAQRMNQERLWNSGLGDLLRVALETAQVPNEPMTPEQFRSELGMTETHERCIRAGVGILREVFKR
jgi:hypothetical protein